MSGPGGVLGLHLNGKVGWCYGCTDDKPDYGSWLLPKTQDQGEVGAAFFDALGDTCKVNRPSGAANISASTRDHYNFRHVVSLAVRQG